MSDIINQTFSIVASASGGDRDWCSNIRYTEVDMCYVRAYLQRNQRFSCCFPPSFFFGLPPSLCRKGTFPIPTDAGLSKSLPILPLGFHYGQSSTDSLCGRARAGVWAKDQGNIYVVPWLQSTEDALIMWEGIKRTFSEADPVDDDPLLHQAMAAYARWKHNDKWTKDEAEAARAKAEYEDCRVMLIRQCREETRIRSCEPSHARSAPGQLFYNDEQSFTATCPDGQTGSPITQVIQAGTVASNKSVADANAQAKTLATEQAKARLDCTPTPVTYYSTPQSYTAQCAQTAGAPVPDGNPVTVNLPAGAATSTVSQAAADAAALAMATEQAQNGLACTWWNAEQEFEAICASDSNENVTKTTQAHTFSSTLSQSDADQLALNAAKVAAEEEMTCPEAPVVYKNTEQNAVKTISGCGAHGPVYQGGILISPGDPGCTVSVIVIVAANYFSSTVSQADANQQAKNYAQAVANQRAQSKCLIHECGEFVVNIP